ncbi:putative oligopeptide transporter, OPT superfamily [Helianthus annuus]|nr:putative oligopeptide transporter, OPT superfamily [Helianthus annuus]
MNIAIVNEAILTEESTPQWKVSLNTTLPVRTICGNYFSYMRMKFGGRYNVSRVLDSATFSFDKQGYNDYSKINLSIFFSLAYGLSFPTLAATLSHVALFHGRTIWEQTRASFGDKFVDVHTRIMKKNYDPVPQWWFYPLLILIIGLALLTCEGFGRQLQLPYWGVLLGIGLALLFTLPICVITATTNHVTD